jgi:putative yddW
MKMKRTWFSGLIGKLIAMLLVINTLASLQVYAAVTPVKRNVTVNGTVAEQKELRGVWFSYIDWSEMPSDVEAFKKRADQVMADIKNRGMNAIFCHVHSHSDSYGQKLKSFPLSKFMVTKDSSADFDPLEYMIESAHKQGL